MHHPKRVRHDSTARTSIRVSQHRDRRHRRAGGGRTRYPEATFGLLEPDEAHEVIEADEQEHPRTARRTLSRMLDGDDFSKATRRSLAETGTVVAF